jgi:hypothetical protein
MINKETLIALMHEHEEKHAEFCKIMWSIIRNEAFDNPKLLNDYRHKYAEWHQTLDKLYEAFYNAQKEKQQKKLIA